MKKNFFKKCLISLGLLLFFTFLPHIMQTPVSIAQASEIEKEKNNEYRLNLRSITLVNGKSFTLRVYNLENDAKVTFRSADPEIASVNDDGVFTANKVGTTTITATVRRGLNTTPLTCEVTVGPPAFSVKLTRSRLFIGLEQSFLLEVVMKPYNTAESPKFSSFDPTIASVSTGGRVTARSHGMTFVFAEIDATYQDGSRKFSTCSVIVTNPEDVPLLIDYFQQHPELNILSEVELTSALFDFFNSVEPVDTSASTTDAAQATDTGAGTDNSTSTTNTTASTLSENEDTSELPDILSGQALIEALDRHLSSRFDMAELKQKYEERFLAITETQLSSLHVGLKPIR